MQACECMCIAEWVFILVFRISAKFIACHMQLQYILTTAAKQQQQYQQ